MDIIAGHLRKLAENNEFGESFLLWEIDQLIKHISKIISRIVDKPLRQDHGDEAELIEKLLRILAFYWVAFHDKKTVSERRADDCGESLVFVGLQFFKRGRPEVLRTCISNIRSIFESYCEIAQPADPYTVGDLLVHLWGIRMALIVGHNNALTEEVDHALIAKPRGLSEKQWESAQEPIMRRRQQLEERIAQRDDGLDRQDSAEALLRRLLKDVQGQAN